MLPGQVTVYDAYFYGSVKIIAAFTKTPYWTYFSFRAL